MLFFIGGIVYSVPMPPEGDLIAIVAAMIPSSRIARELEVGVYGTMALLVNDQGGVFKCEDMPENIFSWFKARFNEAGTASFFKDLPQRFQVEGWSALWTPVQITSEHQWWLIHLYDPADRDMGNTMGLFGLPAGLLVLGLALAFVVRGVFLRADDRLRLAREQEQNERLINAITESTSGAVGKAFFQSLIKQLASTYQIQYALVGEFDGAVPDKLRVLTMWEGEGSREEFDIDLNGTPFQRVVEQGIFICTQALQDCFPEDSLLAELGAQSFHGILLRDAANEPIGLLAVMNTQPMPADSRVLDAPLRLFGSRVRAELERKRSEAEKERLMAAINQAAETIVITDVEGTIEYVNPAFEQVTGYTREEAVGQNPSILKSGAQDEAFYKKLWATLTAGKTWEGRFINRKKDGTVYNEEATISPVTDAAGTILNYVAVKRDVTAETKLEEQIRQSQKMESIGQLVGGVAHDFNNLLQIINGFTDLARLKLDPKDAAVASLNEVSKAGASAKDLVGQLMAFSRQQVIDPMEIDLNEEIESAQEMLGHIIGENIRLKFVAGKDLQPVFADKGQIHQILMNLCVNARDAMPDGGALTLKTENVVIAPEDLKTHQLTRPGSYVFLSVTDTGCGMDKETCKKIFDPFFTTKEVGKGTGLGLSTVYGIVKQNEGHINVYSEPGQGTVFNIYLAVSQSIPAGIINSIVKNAAAAEGGIETILVVEDDKMILQLSTQILSDAGYTVLTAKDGEEAVRVFEEHADEIDLVMMDVVMPHMGGKKAMAEILKKRPALRHLFVSGYSQDAGHNDFIKDKKLHLLNKPYQVAALLQKVREVLDEDQKTED